jgi:flavin reductase (DIM6/NTAB) family NADH-FMN oxidoreductase RutF
MGDADDQHLHDAFLEAMRRFAATVCVLTCRDADGERHGMAATAVTSLSLEPVSIVACVNRATTFYAGFARATHFCVNVLAESQADQSRIFGSSKFRDERFQVGEWRDDPATGAPMLVGAQANLVCLPDGALDYGSHTVIAGRVLGVAIGAVDGPLLHLNRQTFAASRMMAKA